MRYSRERILILSFLLEGALTLIFFVWARYRDIAFPAVPQMWEVGYGVLACIPLFVLNVSLFGPLSRRYEFLRSCYDFKDRIVRPLAESLDVGSAAAIALCAGIGEELFFRGVIQHEFGIVGASVAFSVLHFGTAVRKYLFLTFLYTAIGFYFGYVAEYFESLWIVIIAHATYDFMALLYLRYADTAELDPTVQRLSQRRGI